MNDIRKSKEISLKELILKTQEWFKYLLSKWYVILIAGFLGGVLGFFYTSLMKPIYTATTTFVLESGGQGSALGQYAGMAAMVGIDLEGKGGDGIFQGDNLQDLYKSRKMIEATLLMASASDKSILLLDRYLAMTKSKEGWKKTNPHLLKINFIGENPPVFERAKDSVLKVVVNNINKDNLLVGKPDVKKSIVKVDVKSTDEIFSKEFNEALVTEVNKFYIQTKTKKSLENIEILQHKTDSVRRVMNGNISTAAFVLDATPNLNPTRQAQRLVPTQKSQISAETNKAILSELVKNLEMSKMGLMQDSPLIQKIDEPVYPLDKKRMGKAIGIILGSIILAFFTTVLLLFRKLFKNILA
ncbi:lipopolysaccharide biosynthesis protein [Sphingobacterium anhuiense]|uniref:lipopolysaccharide biosynthesis protein n=1 Tax=Sphingobacterium anhuiense TaxID=493780 RepID=UPI003C2B33B3